MTGMSLLVNYVTALSTQIQSWQLFSAAVCECWHTEAFIVVMVYIKIDARVLKNDAKTFSLPQMADF